MKRFLLLVLIACKTLNINAQTFPPGFSQVKVGTIYYPTAMAFAPDGRIFAAEKSGKVKIIKNGTVLSKPFLQVSVNQVNERGLSCVALDPNFSSNHFVYIYYTTASEPIHNRLSRFTANGDVAVAGSEVKIIDFEPCVGTIHNSGGMVFGADGKLFIAIGNDNENSYSQDLNNHKGKILRINTDGSAPSGNPFTGSVSAKRIWAYGLRNPWTIAIQPGTGKLFVNDVGQSKWEEINNATIAGKNFGWPGSEGNTTNTAYTSPVFTYPHGVTGSNDGCAITGGDFFNSSSTNYPSQYQGNYFFIDYCNDWINYLDNNNQKHNFAKGLPGSQNYLKIGTDGNIYYFSITENALYKIIYSNNNAPVITNQPDNLTVAAGQPATFNVSASGANPLSYQWQKNGVNISGANAASYTINNVQSSHAGNYRAIVSNSSGSATSNSATLTVGAFNTKPVATINSPASGTTYHYGDIINFSGSATDNEDGTLPASAFNWVIEFHHDQHLHPGPNVPPGVKSGSFSTAFGETSANTYFRIILIVTDANGLKDSAIRDIHPITSFLKLASQPSGLKILLEGQPCTTPYSELAISGMTRALDAVTPQTLSGTNYVFDHWTHGGNASQNILIADNDTTYTAVFKPGTATICNASGKITRDYWANVTGTSIADVPVNTTPTSSSLLTIFEGPTRAGDHYGSRIRGYICPPTTGNYTFWIASDNSSELWLSANDQPSAKVKIAFVNGYTASRNWTKYPGQQSAPINLTAGTKYYIEAIHREGTNSDNLAVGWQLPGGTMERPIPGSRLSPYSAGTSPPTVSITSPANNASFPNPVNITITANANSVGSTISKVEFFQGSTKIGEDLSEPYNFTWMNVSTGNYALKAVATDNIGQTGNSQIVNISVTNCPTPIITPSGPTTMCSGSVTLTTSTGTGYSFQWKKDGVEIAGATNPSYTASESGDYQVKVIHGSCIAWSAPKAVRIQSTLSASITPGGPTSFCAGGNVKLYANTCSDYIYKWKKNDAYISGANSATYTATTSGNYQLQVTKGTSNAWSSILTVTVSDCSIPPADRGLDVVETFSEKQSSNLFQMKIFPNPNNGQFTILLNLANTNEEKVKIRVLNMLGQEVYQKEFANNSDYIRESVELDNALPTGIYTLQVTVGNAVENTSVILSK